SESQSLGLNLTGKCSIPFAGSASLDSQGLDSSFYRPMKLDFDMAYFGKRELALLYGETRLSIGNGIVSRVRSEAGISSPFTIFYPPKESSECSIQTSQHVLQYLRMYGLEISTIFFDSGKLILLLSIIDGFAYQL